MWHTISTGWNFIRIARLLLGIAALTQAVILGEWILAIAGALIAGMALANTGCGIGGCNTMPPAKNQKVTHNQTKDINYEEVDYRQ